MEATENIYGTSLQGYIKASYEQLLKAFGPPNPNLCDNYKTDVEWAFEFADGTVATLYNWKNGKNYLGDEVRILGASSIIYSPDKPLSCGAKVWIETDAEVAVIYSEGFDYVC